MNTIRNTVLAACLLALPGLAPAASFTGTDRSFIWLWLTMWSSSYRVSSEGLKI